MFIVIEYNGEYIMGCVLDIKTSEIKKFKTEEKASEWCKNNCAFNYKIVEL
jgi:hypothetical protein